MQSEGRDPELFVNQINEELICAICQCVLKDPMDTPCGHVFCRSCILESWRRSPTCPFDRSTVEPSELRESTKAFKNILSNLLTFCDFKNQGCPWEGEWSTLPNHLEKCCWIAANLKKEGKMECPHCSSKLSPETRKHHLEEECKEVVISCPFAIYGCSERFQRSLLDQHQQTFTGKHLNLLSSAIASLNKKIEKDNKIQTTKSKPEKKLTKVQHSSKVKFLAKNWKKKLEEGSLDFKFSFHGNWTAKLKKSSKDPSFLNVFIKSDQLCKAFTKVKIQDCITNRKLMSGKTDEREYGPTASGFGFRKAFKIDNATDHISVQFSVFIVVPE